MWRTCWANTLPQQVYRRARRELGHWGVSRRPDSVPRDVWERTRLQGTYRLLGDMILPRRVLAVRVPFPRPPCSLFCAQFLPNVGRIVVEALEGTLDPAIAARFAVDRDVAGATNGERVSDVTQPLDEGELCGPEAA